MKVIVIQVALIAMNVFLAGLFIGIGKGYLALILIPAALFAFTPIETEVEILRAGGETYAAKKRDGAA